MPTHVLISSVKDEGPFVLEWLAHHLAIGFDRVAVASNDCSDGTDRLLDALAEAGWVAHVRNRVPPGEPPQHAAYAAIRKAEPIDAADWLAVLDVDEFLNVHARGHGVGDLTALAAPEVDLITLHALTFAGAEGAWSPGRVAPRLTGRLRLRHKGNTMLKSLTRGPGRFGAIHNHSLVEFRGPGPLVAMGGDGALRTLPRGARLRDLLRHEPVSPNHFWLAQVNHYATKWRDSYALRRLRGRGAAPPGAEERHTEAYWADRTAVEAEERSILRHDRAVEALMARMLADPRVERAQGEAERLYGAMAARALHGQPSGWRQEAE